MCSRRGFVIVMCRALSIVQGMELTTQLVVDEPHYAFVCACVCVCFFFVCHVELTLVDRIMCYRSQQQVP